MLLLLLEELVRTLGVFGDVHLCVHFLAGQVRRRPRRCIRNQSLSQVILDFILYVGVRLDQLDLENSVLVACGSTKGCLLLLDLRLLGGAQPPVVDVATFYLLYLR